ncbi:hypothetical protein [Actinomadura sp. 3N407]|uniref:hypothetical protein n=1 Tax=Actinomadura sp. 3N407 TaxID=3457423 RepID=UPI003FCDEA74
MPDEWDEPHDHEPLSWRIRRWAAPIAMALSVAASIGAVQLLADEHVSSATPYGDHRKPRFFLTVGRLGGPSQDNGPEPWFQVHSLHGGRQRPVDSVRPPSPSAGKARELLTGPKGMHLVASSREEPCESRLYRFRLDGDGQATDIAPVHEGVIPSRVAGMAMSPDGDRLAFATAPCTDVPQPSRARLTVLDLDSGGRRTWSTSAPSVIGGIVWASDNDTLGYTLSDVRRDAPSADGTVHQGVPNGGKIVNVTLYALDTDEQGTDLHGARRLFRQPDDFGRVTSAVMAPDGRTGYGVMKKGQPATTIIFTFAEDEPMRVTKTIAPKPNTAMLFSFSTEEEPRYACLGGIDAFGRAINGEFPTISSDFSNCGSTYAY